MRLFGIGGGLGVGGVWLDNSWFIYAALLTLVLAVGLRAKGGDLSDPDIDDDTDEDDSRPEGTSESH